MSPPCICQGSVTVGFAKGHFGFSWSIMYLQLLHKCLSTLKPVLAYRFIYSFRYPLQIVLQVPCCITEVSLKVSEVSQWHVQNEKITENFAIFPSCLPALAVSGNRYWFLPSALLSGFGSEQILHLPEDSLTIFRLLIYSVLFSMSIITPLVSSLVSFFFTTLITANGTLHFSSSTLTLPSECSEICP